MTQQATPATSTYKAFTEPGNWDSNHTTFCNWWQWIITWIECQQGLSNKQKTATVLLHLTGKAEDYTWVQLTYYNDLEEQATNYTTKVKVWLVWATVKKGIEDHFRIDVLKEEAYRKLALLKQETLPIEVFTQQFDILQLDAGVEDDYTLHVYKENINYNINFQLSLHEPTITETLTEWKKHVVIIGKTFNRMWLK